MRETRHRLVVIESPYAGKVARNVAYARLAMRDAFQRGEYPYASHLLYTQPSVLDDDSASERELGITAGLVWARHATLTAAYVDLGISPGMERALRRAEDDGQPVEMRRLAGYSQHRTEPPMPYWVARLCAQWDRDVGALMERRELVQAAVKRACARELRIVARTKGCVE